LGWKSVCSWAGGRVAEGAAPSPFLKNSQQGWRGVKCSGKSHSPTQCITGEFLHRNLNDKVHHSLNFDTFSEITHILTRYNFRQV